MEVYQHLVSELDANGQHLSDQISEIDLTDPEDARVLMPEQGTDILAHFGADHFLERYQRYKAHIAEWRQQYPKLAEVDLRYEQQVVLQMAAAAEPLPANVEFSRSDAINGLTTAKADAGKLEVQARSGKARQRRNTPNLPEHRQGPHARQAGSQRQRHTKHKPRQKKKHPDPKHTVKKSATEAAAADPSTIHRPSERTMSEKQDNLIVVLDMGSAWTRVLAADVNEGALRYRGHGVIESTGMRKGLISELGPAAKVVKQANEQAEWTARANIDQCVVGVGGPHIRGLNTNGGLDLGSRMREITREDVRAAVERARAVERPPDREILHLLPRQFILDDQPGIFDPVGMVGARLEVDLHIATCSGERAAKHRYLRQSRRA